MLSYIPAYTLARYLFESSFSALPSGWNVTIYILPPPYPAPAGLGIVDVVAKDSEIRKITNLVWIDCLSIISRDEPMLLCNFRG